MNEDIEQISNMLKRNSFDESTMFDILEHYREHPPVIHIRLQKGCKILRSSINNEPSLFVDISRLSYPPPQKARTDRTSLQGCPMFYGSIFTSAAISANAYPRIVCAMETTDILHQVDKDGKAVLTQSLWNTTRALTLMAFPFSKALMKPCYEILCFQEDWYRELYRKFSIEAVQFAEYLGDELSKKKYSCLYEITAHIIYNILYHSMEASRLDGIVYPSVWCDGQGMNICLKREVVDECIEFQGAQVQRIYKQNGEATMIPMADSQMDSEGKLQWSPNPKFLKLLRSIWY